MLSQQCIIFSNPKLKGANLPPLRYNVPHTDFVIWNLELRSTVHYLLFPQYVPVVTWKNNAKTIVLAKAFSEVVTEPRCFSEEC